MTSKEALKILFMTCDEELLQDNYNILFASQLEEIIRKDLDKLEKSSWKYDVLPPTLEEVKKEWEELGYKWKETNKFILLYNNIEEKSIRIYKSFKLYHVKALGENYFENVSFALHQLLTKTFKALGWI